MKSSNSLSSSQASKLLEAAQAGKIRELDPEQKIRIRDRLKAEIRLRDLRNAADGLTMDLQSFFRRAWSIIEPETLLIWSWHYEYLCSWLTLISSGEFKKRYPEKLGIIINVPPRSGKSALSTIIWPVWTWLEHPERRFLCGSYSLELAIDHANKRRFIVKSQWFQECFGNRFAPTTDKTDDFRNNKTGYFICTSPDSAGTGFGGDICIGDDLLNAQDAYSEAKRKSTNRWLDDTFRRRLNNPAAGAFVHISQRLNEEDPTGHLLEKNPGEWIHLKIKREAEEDERYEFPDGRVVERKKGDILQPERCPAHVLRSMKLIARTWAGQEQQEPTPTGGAILNPNWLRGYQASTALPTFYQVIISVDCAFK